MSKSRNFAKLPGFRDFPPEDLALRNHLFDAWRRVSRRYGFLEFDGPPLEGLELYTQKSGEEIVGQLYDFTDKGGRSVALRPEMTPTLARMLGERSRALPKPIRWFAIPQLFRYERQQRGRLREHFQWNVDLVGEEGIEGDAEVLAIALDGLRELGLGVEDLRARVSDRILLAELLQGMGVHPDRLGSAFAIIDKIERESVDRTAQRLCDPKEVGLSAEAADRILALFASPGLEEVAALARDIPAAEARIAELRRFLAVLSDLGLSDYVEFDLRIVRGLAYYTGIVFEVFDRRGEFRAVCGGGRYDTLLERTGGEALPAVGFGMGDVVLSELLKERGLAPEYRREIDFYIIAVEDGLLPLARRIAASLREEGHRVVHPLRHQTMKKQFSAAAVEGAHTVIILGPDEVSRGVAKIRDMHKGGESEIALDRWLGAAAGE